MEDQALNGAGGSGGATGDGGDLARREPGTDAGFKQQAKDSVRDARQQVKTQVRERTDQVKQSANRMVDERTHTLSESVNALAAAFDAAASSLGDRRQERLAGWTRDLSGRARRIATYLDQADTRGLVTDLEGTAREHPAAFVGTSFAAGLAAGRFLRASTRDDRSSATDRGVEVEFEPDAALMADRATSEAAGSSGYGNSGTGYGTTGSGVAATRTGPGDVGFGPTRTGEGGAS
ncbi:MAG TPA: hypothetical protein VMN78_01560 [Longimicrobiales bacterium]|nr:hypothetical protein [Longimicrobiales bacterium]